ncbi:MAG: competence/damage-inducible protein A [Firmicutes bacterium]|nr:competence/damage-inducible protein A [Bacillota bacterium]
MKNKEWSAEIIAIGTEILLGDIVNTNASYIAKGLASLGIDLFHQQVVGDNPERVLEAFRLAFGRADIVITTGGLGPTGDDLSKEMGAVYFDVPMVENQEARANIEDRLRQMHRDITPNNWKQAMLPQGAVPLQNAHGTAPGFVLRREDKILIMLPGPPSEMRPMFDEQVCTYLRSLSDEVMLSRTLHLCGIGESALEYRLHDRMERMTNPTLAPYAKTGMVDLRITAKAATQEEAWALISPVEAELRQELGTLIYGSDEDTLESVVGRLLIEKKITVSAAESCTGGLFSGQLINYNGISEVYKAGFITYSNEAKEQFLGVPHEVLVRYGAVSMQTARAMAEGAARAAKTDAAVAITGIAGPGGGTPEKPVGLIYVGVCVRGRTEVLELHLKGDRQENRHRTVIQALNKLRLMVLEEPDPES